MISTRRALVFALVVALGVAAAPDAGAGQVGDGLHSRLDHVIGILID